MANITQLRTQHPTFTYQSYSWKIVAGNNLTISFLYTISPDITFQPSVTIHNVTQEMVEQLGTDVLNNYVFHLGLSELLSYWKVSASPKIEIQAGKLSQEEITFWHKLLLKGMGEFFYQNTIDFSEENFVTFSSNSTREHTQNRAIQEENHHSSSTETTNNKTNILVPIGGGKDSAVTVEILKNISSVGTVTISAPQSAQTIIDTANIPQEKQIKITRVLDPKLFQLNESGYLNGHVPISAYFAFLSIFTADLFGYTHVAISNERSSNEGNVWYCDQEVNHQYSKTYEFEHDLRNYVAQFLPRNAPEYFSFLRPLYELQIAQVFSQFTQYHSVFRSCNRGQKQNVWCCKCSKCLFAWTVLFPFLGPEKLSTYFGKNLYEDEALWPIAQDLLGLRTTKPFDCVGTHEETTLAFYLNIQQFERNNAQLPVLLQKVAQELQSNQKLHYGPNGESNFAARIHSLMTDWNSEHFLPQKLVAILKQNLKNSERAAEFSSYS